MNPIRNGSDEVKALIPPAKKRKANVQRMTLNFNFNEFLNK